jgi:hypothetical protein
MPNVFYCSECDKEEVRHGEDELGGNTCSECLTPMTAIAEADPRLYDNVR